MYEWQQKNIVDQTLKKVEVSTMTIYCQRYVQFNNYQCEV